MKIFNKVLGLLIIIIILLGYNEAHAYSYVSPGPSLRWTDNDFHGQAMGQSYSSSVVKDSSGNYFVEVVLYAKARMSNWTEYGVWHDDTLIEEIWNNPPFKEIRNSTSNVIRFAGSSRTGTVGTNTAGRYIVWRLPVLPSEVGRTFSGFEGGQLKANLVYYVRSEVIDPSTGKVEYTNKTDYGGTVGVGMSGYYTVPSFWNTPPTTPSSINMPSMSSGTASTVSWGASSDSDDDPIQYLLERNVNGGGWSQVYAGTPRTFIDTPQSTWATVTYRVRAYDGKDYSGYKTSSQVTVIHDTTPPTISLSQSPTTPTNGNVTVTATITDASGVSVKKYASGNRATSYFSSNGTTLASTFTVTSNGTYTVYAKDTAGNESIRTITISNIDKTPPVITLSSYTTSPTNQNITVTATTNEGTLNSTSRLFTTNGSFTFKATDAAGNVTNRTVTINNIDKTSPVITLGSYTTSPTNQNITVTATTNEGTLNAASRLFTANGSFTFTATDAAGNVTNRTVTINNIDKTSPVITLGSYTTSPTNQNITVTATTNEGTLNAASRLFTTNGSFTFKATDAAGNVTNRTVTINNIDKTPPTKPTLVSSKTTPTNQNVNVTITYSGDSTIKQYKIGSGSWQNYAIPIVLSSNNTVYARGRDAAGNYSTESSLTVSNIDKTSPVITIGTYDTNPTNKDITVTATTNEGTLNKASHTFKTNGSFTFTATDAAGNVTTKTVTINNIDKLYPNLTIGSTDNIWYNSNINVNISHSDTGTSGVAVKQYLITASTSKPSSGWLNLTSTNQNITVSSEGNNYVHARIIDGAGNETYDYKGPFKVDKTPPTSPTITADESWSKTNVSVTISQGTDGLSGVSRTEYQLTGAQIQGWTTYTGAISITTDGQTTISARTIDNAGNLSPVVSKVIRLDKTAPSSPTINSNTAWSNTDVHVTITQGTDATSGISRTEYQLNGAHEQGWTKYVSGFNVNNEGYTTIQARTIDNAGNVSALTTRTVRIDKTNPTVVIQDNDYDWHNPSITVNVQHSDSLSDVSSGQYLITQSTVKPSSGWLTLTSTNQNVTVSNNGDNYVHVKVIDNAGNETYDIKGPFKIDIAKPTVYIDPNGNITYQINHTTRVKATDTQSGIAKLEYRWLDSANNANNAIHGWQEFINDSTITTPNNLSGDHYLELRITDNKANQLIDKSNAFKLDNTQPTVAVTGNPTDFVPDEVTLNAKGEDEHSGFKRMRVLGKQPDGTWIVIRDWNVSNNQSYTTTVNGEFFFEVEDNVGLTNTDALGNPPIGDVIVVNKINSIIKLNRLDIKPEKQKLTHLGTDTILIARNDFHVTIEAVIEDQDIDDEITYTLDITGPENYQITKSITGRSHAIHNQNETIMLVRADSSNWPDGIYTVTVTVTDSKPGMPNITTDTLTKKFLLLREKPPLPVINIGSNSSKADITFPVHPILTGELSTLVVKEYAEGTSNYLTYVSEIDLSGLTKPTSIFAKYTDINGNYTVASKEYLPDIPEIVSEIPPLGANVKIENNRSTTSIYINIRKADDNTIDTSIFQFLN